VNVALLWLKLLFTLIAAVVVPPVLFALAAAVLEAGKMVIKEVKTILTGPTWKDRGFAFHRLLILVVVVPFIVATAAMIFRAIATAVRSRG